MAQSARPTSTNSLQELITQVAHGFSVGDIVINQALVGPPTYALAQADTLAHAFGAMMISIVVDANSFYVSQDGYVSGLTTNHPIVAGGLVAGTIYYLSAAAPNTLTTTAPSGVGNVVLGCFKADSTTSGFFFGGAGAVGSGGGSVASVTASSPLASSGGANPNISISVAIPLNDGGTNNALVASNGGLLYSDATKIDILAGTATANQIPLSGSSAAPAWSTATYPATTTANDILYSSAANTIGQIATANDGVLVTSNVGVPSILAGSGVSNNILLSQSAAAPVWSTATYPVTTTINQLLWSSAANTVGGLATANNAVILTSNAGVPAWSASLTNGQMIIGSTGNTPVIGTIAAGAGVTVTPGAGTLTISATGSGGTVTSVSGTAGQIDSTGGATPVISIDAAYVGQTSITTLGTITTGVWNGTVIDLAHGGTNHALTADNGGIVYSDASKLDILAHTATALQMLQSGASAAPAWSTATYPATTTINQLLYSSSANVVAGLSTANSSLLVTNGSGVPSLSTAIPNGVTATTQTINDASTNVATTAYVNNTVKLGQTNVAASSNTTFTQAVSTNQYFKITVSSNCTLAFTFDAGLVESMCLQLINAGAFTVTWTSILWPGGAAPTFTTSGTDMVVIWHNGDNIMYGALIGKAFA